MKIRKLSEAKWEVCIAYWDKEISIQQFKAQMKDLGCDDWEINLFLDGDDPELDFDE